RRGHEVEVERQAVAGVEEPVDAVRAEHVRELVRVEDDRRRAEWEDEPGELVGEELRRLEVHVRVDEARDDEAAGRVEHVAPLVVAEPGDPAVDDRDPRLQPLAREDGQHTAAADDEIGGLVAAGDGEAAGEVDAHASPNPLTAAQYAFRPWRS